MQSTLVTLLMEKFPAKFRSLVKGASGETFFRGSFFIKTFLFDRVIPANNFYDILTRMIFTVWICFNFCTILTHQIQKRVGGDFLNLCQQTGDK